MESDRPAGILMSTGAALALLGMALTPVFVVFFFYFLSGPSFILVFLFGVYVARRRAEARILPLGTLWFATVGGIPFLWTVAIPAGSDASFLVPSYLGLAGVIMAIAGAGLKLAGPGSPARPADPRWFERAAGLLGSGSLALLLAAAAGYPGLSPPGYEQWVWTTVFLVIALWLHLIAWIALFAATDADFRGATAASRLNLGRLAWTVSVVSFIAAIYLAPLYRLPFPSGAYLVLPLPWFVPPFPYQPAVFAPVVLCHAFIFRAYSRFLPTGPASTFARMGVLALVTAASVGLLGLFAYGAGVDLSSAAFWWLVLPFPSGSTAIGYGLVFYGWRQGTHLARAFDDESTRSEAIS